MEIKNPTSEYATKTDLKELGQDIQQNMQALEQRMTVNMQNYMGALYEKFHGEVRLLAEQVGSLDKKIDRTDAKVDIVIEAVADIKVELAVINDKLDRKVDRDEFERRIVPLEAMARAR